MSKRPNILFFMPETLRSDAVIGDPETRAKTPVMDDLAGGSVSFANCYSQSPFCTPSRCSMFTGLYPHTMGHRSLLHMLRRYERNLFQDLKEAGYTTACFGKNDLLAQESIEQSFDEVQLRVKPRDATWPKTQLPEDHKYYGAFYDGCRKGENCHDLDAACIESALEFLDEEHEKPFCLFLPLLFAHPPYTVEEPYFSMHDRSKVSKPIPCKLDGKRTGFKMTYNTRELDRLTEEDLLEIRATYYGMVSRLDHQLGMVIDKLKERELYDNTATIVFSDHGDYAGDYGYVEKWNFGFDDALLHVPLIMRVPGMEYSGTRRCMVEMVDLYPTVLELAGIEPKHYHFGRSLLPLFEENAPDSHRNAVFAEAGWAEDEKHCSTPYKKGQYPRYEKQILQSIKNPSICSRAAMVRTEEYKYVYCPGDRDELYDLTTDPGQVNNVAETFEMASVRTELREKLLKWLLDTSDSVPLDHDPRNWG